MELSVGCKAPDFNLPSSDGKNISLKDLRGKKIVLFFYPKDDTPGCTKEACSFRDTLSAMQNKGAVVIGISADSLKMHEKFIRKYSLPFPLLSDETKSVLKTYGVWKKKSMFGVKFLGIVRTTFIIDENGIIQKIFPKVKVEGHTEEVLKILEQ
jgi:peroxiredoxin Q/BCP